LSNGAIVYGKNLSGYGGRGIYIYRDSLEPELQHLEKFLDSSGVFVDIGASTGVYTMKAAKHFQDKGIVLALEPFPDVFATLYHNVEANSFTNVRARNICAAGSTGVRSFWLNLGKPNSFSLIKRDENALCISTLSISLDELVEVESLETVNYLKIDVEGAEEEVLNGAAETIKNHRPIIQMEVTVREINFESNGYVVFRAPQSPNEVHIPKEHPKIGLPKQLGWKQIR
jgi:FkbM family methyltransferase